MTISQSGLTLPTRTEAEARADIAASETRRQIAIETNRQWRQLLDLNAEWERHIDACNSPEGRAVREDFAKFRAEHREREEAKLIADLIVRNAP